MKHLLIISGNKTLISTLVTDSSEDTILFYLSLSSIDLK